VTAQKPASGRVTWRDRLSPFAELQAELVSGVDRLVSEATDTELTKLLQAAGRPDSTNCWWAIFQVAPVVIEAVGQERWRRKAARRAARRAAA
jgi:hypothetical protein